jgi:hypothetical protein
MDINYLVLVIVSIILALAYDLPGYFNNLVTKKEDFDFPSLAATVIYSIVVGFLAVQSGLITLVNLSQWQDIFSGAFATYAGLQLVLLYFFTKVAVPVVTHLTARTTWYTPKFKGAAPGRKMDPESRKFLVFDLPAQNQGLTLTCVDQAESTIPIPFQYAIESGQWVFLIENAELTGAKHYLFKGWLGVPVQWKPISAATLAACRKSGFIQEYDDLT